jgi:hypothetical protein
VSLRRPSSLPASGSSSTWRHRLGNWLRGKSSAWTCLTVASAVNAGPPSRWRRFLISPSTSAVSRALMRLMSSRKMLRGAATACCTVG